MSVDPKTPTIRQRTHGQPWLSVGTVALLAALSLLASLPAQASGPRGEIPDRIFADGFEQPQPPGEVERLPAADSLLSADALPEIGLRLLEGELDPAGWRLFVDDEDVTSLAQASASGIVYTPDEPLFEGDHTIQVRHGLRVWSWGFRTSTPPFVTDRGIDPTREDNKPIPNRRPTLWAEYRDSHSGIDISNVRLILNQEDVTNYAQVDEGRMEFKPAWDLEDGYYSAFLFIRDRAGNSDYAPFFFDIGEIPVIEVGPLDEVYSYGSYPEVRASFWAKERDISLESIRLWFGEEDVTELASINMTSPRAGEIRFQPAEALSSGLYFLSLEVGTSGDFVGREDFTFLVDELRTYRFDILSPRDGEIVTAPIVEVRVRADLRVGELDANPFLFPSLVFVNGEEAWALESDDGSLIYADEVELNPGNNVIHVRVVFDDGKEVDSAISIVHIAPPEITVTSPADWSSFGPVDAPGGGAIPGGARDLTGAVQRPIAITGTTTMPVVSVQINQQQAQVGPDGRSFTFPTYFLHEGANHISAVATDAHGRSASDQITVYVDQTAPLRCKIIYEDAMNAGAGAPNNVTADRRRLRAANRKQADSSDGDHAAVLQINGFHFHGWGCRTDSNITRLVFWDPVTEINQILRGPLECSW